MKGNTKKANHFVSKCYLEGFIDPAENRKLWRYGFHNASNTLSVDLVLPEKTGFVNSLYKLDEAGRAWLEDVFGAVEGFFPATRERLNNFRPISRGDELVLTMMCLIHQLRNPSFAADLRKHGQNAQLLLEQAPALNAEDRATFVAHYNKVWGDTLNFEQVLRHIAADPLITNATDVEILRHGVGQLFRLIATKFKKLSWKFLVPPLNGFFITSDNPFLYNNSSAFRLVMQHDVDPEKSFDVQMLMPVSPMVAAIGIEYEGYVDRPSSERIGHETLANLNNLVIRNRNRYVYAHINSSDLPAQIEVLENQRLR